MLITRGSAWLVVQLASIEILIRIVGTFDSETFYQAKIKFALVRGFKLIWRNFEGCQTLEWSLEQVKVVSEILQLNAT